MWSFIASVVVFVTLIVALRLWQRRQHQRVQGQVAVVDQQIYDVAEVAQRRHVQRFGRASTDLTNTLNGLDVRIASTKS
jgi:hypothetical protein